MEKYELLMIDIDDTLIDNQRAIKYALFQTLKYLGIPASDEIFTKWMEFDINYWYLWESGLMEVPEEVKKDKKNLAEYLRSKRFLEFFKYLNISFETAIKLNEIYITNLDVDIIPLDDASEVIKELNDYYRIIITTNGPIKPANTKINKLKINDYIDHIYCAEEVGFSKPMPEFFEYVFEKENISKEKVLIIGDSLSSDIQSGMISEFDTMWYNPKEIILPDNYKPTYIIKDLHEIKRTLTQ